MGKRKKRTGFDPSKHYLLFKDDDALELTKIDIAEAQLRAAVCMYFEGGHPVPVYTLANAAREIVDSIANQMGITRIAQDVAEVLGMPTKEFLREIKSTANFFKHADRGADKKLLFDEEQVRTALAFACFDFEDVANSLPMEGIVFRMWVRALTAKVTKMPLSSQQHIRNCIRFFPGLRQAADLAEQKRIGLEGLRRALADPLQRETFKRFNREVFLPKTSTE